MSFSLDPAFTKNADGTLTLTELSLMPPQRRPRFLCTGGCGFIGHHLVKTLQQAGAEVMVIDDMSSGNHRPATSVVFHCMDINSPLFIEFARAWKPAVIFHLAAQASLLKSVQDPVYDAKVNILGTLRVIEAARQTGARLVTASTSAVYDQTVQPPWTEDTRVRPDRPYGASKAAAEMYVAISEQSHAILRFGNVIGPGQVKVGENQVVPHALDHLFLSAPFTVNGDGEQTRDFIYVGDVVDGLIAAARSTASGIFNIGTGVPTTVNELLSILAEVSGKTVEWKHGPAKPNEPRQNWLDPSRAWKILNWRAQYDVEEALRRTVADYQKTLSLGG